jgi:hypothetical protein
MALVENRTTACGEGATDQSSIELAASMTAVGRLGDVAYGSFAALQFAKSRFF